MFPRLQTERKRNKIHMAAVGDFVGGFLKKKGCNREPLLLLAAEILLT